MRRKIPFIRDTHARQQNSCRKTTTTAPRLWLVFAVLVLFCAAGAGTAVADTISAGTFEQLSDAITNAPSTRTIVIANDIGVGAEGWLPIIGAGKNIILTPANDKDYKIYRTAANFSSATATGLLTISGGSLTIIDNDSHALIVDGGGIITNRQSLVFIDNGGTFTMSGGAIANNTAGDNSGGVYVTHNSNFMMTDGAIINNTAGRYGGGDFDGGGGVYVVYNSNFIMTGGTISGNSAKGGSPYVGDGGGVYVYSGGSFMMAGGTITNNIAANGGGVYVSTSGTFTMRDGMISGNAAKDIPDGGVWINDGVGGGVYVSAGNFTMEGGNITNNVAGYGGGVYVSSGRSTFTMNGGIISNNTIISEYKKGSGGGVYVTHNSNFTMSGSASITNHTAYGGGGVYVTRNSNFTMSGSASITNNAAQHGGGGVNVNSGMFTMSDSASITSNTASIGGGGVSVSSGVFTMSGSASIANNIASIGGGGVYVYNGSNFTMTDGTISGNNAEGSTNPYGRGSGGGVYIVEGSNFMMAGGTISDNNAKGSDPYSGGGGVYVGDYYTGFNWVDGSSSFFTMSDGKIINNTAGRGGGVFVNNGSFNMMNGTISGNYVDDIFNTMNTSVELEEIPISFRASNDDNGVITYTFPYNDSLFSSASTAYNHDLAKISLGLAAASFTHPAADIDVGGGYAKALEKIRYQNINESYKTLGFDKAEFYNYDVPVSDSSNKVAYSIAEKKIQLEDQEYTLYVVVPRGGGYGAEWASNFDIGLGEYSKGFAEPADAVLDTLKSRISNASDLSKVKIWITGFSRGAAVANLVGGELDREADALGLKKENIYVYTFATPQGVDTTYDINRDVRTDYSNIFNIVNPSDLVPTVPLSLWGYERYGTTYYFDYDDESTYSAIGDTYQEITGLTYNPIDLSVMINFIDIRLSQIFDDKHTYATVHSKYVHTFLEILFGDNTNKPKWGNIFFLKDTVKEKYQNGEAAIQYAEDQDLGDEAAYIRKYIDLELDSVKESPHVQQELSTIVLSVISDLEADDPRIKKLPWIIKPVFEFLMETVKEYLKDNDIIDLERDELSKGEISVKVVVSEIIDITYATGALTYGDWGPMREKIITRVKDLTLNIIEILFSNAITEGFVAIGYLNGFDVETSMDEFNNVAQSLQSALFLAHNEYPVGAVLKQHQPEIYMAWLCSDVPTSKIYTTEIIDLSDMGFKQVRVSAVADGPGRVYGTQTVYVNSGDGAKIHVIAQELIIKNIIGLQNPGLSFAGWYDGNGNLLSTDAVYETEVTTDTTFYAKFGYKITYMLYGGVNNAQNPTGYQSKGDDITLKDPTRTIWTFEGWVWNENTVPLKHVTIPTGSTGDKTYYAVWSLRSPHTQDKSFSFDESASIRKITILGAGTGDNAKITQLPEIGYNQFAGLPANSLYPHAQHQLLQPPKNVGVIEMYDIEVTSVAESLVGSTIHFTVDKHDLAAGISPDSVSLYHSSNGNWVKLETVHDKENDDDKHYHYHATTDSFSPFAICYEVDSVSDIIPGTISNSDGNMNDAFRVLFETNGGSIVSPATDLSYGDRITAPAAPVRDGYTFGGWYRDEACTIAWTFASDAVPGDMTLYAKWVVGGVTPTVTAAETGTSAGPTTTTWMQTATMTATTMESPTVAQTPAPVFGVLAGLAAAGVMIRRRLP